MRVVIPLAALTAMLWAGEACAAGVEIKDAVAQVTVVPEDRADVQVVVLAGDPRLPLRVKSGRRTVIDGDLKASRIRGCGREGGEVAVQVAGLGEIPLRRAPRIVIRTPRTVEVTVGGAVFGSIGRAVRVTLGNAGCGDWTVANVDRELKVSVAGSGDVRAAAAGAARLRVAGPGDISVGPVRGRVDVDVAGSGDVLVGSVAGPLDVNVAGSGGVTIAAGRAAAMKVTVAGSGNVEFRGVADSLEARIAGSGDVRARRVRGPVKKAVMGAGRVIVG